MHKSYGIPLEPGGYYHIFNRGISGTPLFYTPANYQHFLKLYQKYVGPIVSTYAWCLMGNHFHLLVRIKEDADVDGRLLPSTPVRVLNPDRDTGGVKAAAKPPHIYFSHLFNAYAQAINKQQGRTGSLFERPFHRISVETEAYLQTLVVYIHQNPVRHGFVSSCGDYPWSSYQSILSTKPTGVEREAVLEWFGGRENFVAMHRRMVDLDTLYE
jgi:REP element-mobilizing transposase RayT